MKISFFTVEETPLQILQGPEICQAVGKHAKKSLHIRVDIKGRNIMALMDTGATSCFI